MLLFLIPNKARWTSLIGNTAKHRTHDRLFHFGERIERLQMEKSVMRNAKVHPNVAKEASSLFSLLERYPHMRVRKRRKKLKIRNACYCNFFSTWRVGNVENKNNSPVNIWFFAKTSDTRNLSKHQIWHQNIASGNTAWQRHLETRAANV